MIYTLTVNPSLDYVLDMKSFEKGIVNRTTGELIMAGGKGLNVSMVLKNLEVETTALGFCAGFTGEEIKLRMKEKGVLCDFIQLDEGFSRINVKIRSAQTEGGEETEINCQGPVVTKDALSDLMRKLSDINAKDYLVLAGSIPSSLPSTLYSDIMSFLFEKGVNVVVDATKSLLVNCLQYRPFLIKPNNHELGDIFGIELKTADQVIPYAKKLQEKGARNVLVSMGEKGAVLVTEDGQLLSCKAPKISVINTVGSGDSMVAGFLKGYLDTLDYNTALKMGIACGSASASREGLCEKDEAEEMYRSIEE